MSFHSPICRFTGSLTLMLPIAALPTLPLQFMASEANRSRYWARSFAGWSRFSSVQPNAAHENIARLQHRGECGGR
jgi:hypothetical protein